MIHLACTHGNLGYWDFYSTVMKVRDIVENNRIITVSESEELFTNNINEILQREVKLNRIKALNSYISTNGERFLGSIVAAIHQGNPNWTEIDINNSFEVDGETIDESSIDFLNSKFGVLTLIGNEQIFALDGQHRLLGLRKAFTDNPETIGELEVSIIFVIHRHEHLDKTRRLFTVLNKYAEKPSAAELIILDEDDAAAILTRKLVTEHIELSKPNGISNSKTGGIPKSDNKSFTTLVTINKINKLLFNKPKAFYSVRPSVEILENLYSKALLFWDSIFISFPELINYIDGVQNITINEIPIYRDDVTGGSLLLRPVGQELLAYAFSKFQENETQAFIDRIKQVELNLSNENWIYLYWNDKMLGKELSLKRKVLSFIIGKFDNEEDIHLGMSRVYEAHNQEYQNHITQVDL